MSFVSFDEYKLLSQLIHETILSKKCLPISHKPKYCIMGNELTKKLHSTDEQNEEGQEEIETTIEDLTRCLKTWDGNKRNH